MSALATVSALLATAFLLGGGEAAPTVRVDIERFAFSPAQLTVKAGSAVVFANHDQAPHSLIGSMGGEEVFRSPEQVDEDETYRIVLTRPGEVTYRCGLHSHMTGKISVTP
jgi:plastocyanin